MAVTKKTERSSVRTVVLLRDSAKKKLEKLAARERVSSGEIIRRSLDSYTTIEARIRKEEEEKVMEATLAIITEAVRSANRSMEDTFKKLDELHLQLNPEKQIEPERQLLQRRKRDSAGNGKHKKVG